MEKTARLARELALSDKARINPPLEEKVLSGDTVDAVPLNRVSPQRVDTSTEPSQEASVNQEIPSPIREVNPSPTKEATEHNDDGSHFDHPPVDDQKKDHDVSETVVDHTEPPKSPRPKRKRGKGGVEGPEQEEDDVDVVLKRARHISRGGPSTYWQEPSFAAPTTREVASRLMNDLGDVPAIDGIDLHARDNVGVVPGHAILERVTHDSYRKSLSKVPSMELIGRGGLLISEVRILFVPLLFICYA